jgi:hypothetical protein
MSAVYGLLFSDMKLECPAFFSVIGSNLTQHTDKLFPEISVLLFRKHMRGVLLYDYTMSNRRDKLLKGCRRARYGGAASRESLVFPVS